VPERIAGIDLFTSLLELADRQRYAVYFLGAEQAVLDEVVRRTRADHPGMRIAGARNGYFDDAEAESVARAIREARPDILFVGITSPKKEVFLSRWHDWMDVPVCHGVGGSFDVIAGKTKRAPRLWQRMGMEWFYRTLQEPRRLWKRYLVTNSIFLWMVASELARSHRHRPAGQT
jgi:N-acetylglucosaminyldiphosphoundecaprenol N-acetyl-beta-D-mannosaminyltransferase